MEQLNTVFGAAASDMYNQSNAAGNAQPGAENNNGNASSSPEAEVTDVDFEEVKEDKK